MSEFPNPVNAPDHIHELLIRLHKLSLEQEATLKAGHAKFATIEKTKDSGGLIYSEPGFNDMMQDKFIALDQDKCQFIYQLIRATRGLNVVEAGTSFGVSTIYLSLAVGQNMVATGQKGQVIATEWEADKAKQARAYWEQCGSDVSNLIDLRVGDLLETLKSDLPPIDLLLLDIWSVVALPTLKVVQPYLRDGAVIIVDNTISSGKSYEQLLAYLRAEGSGFRNMTLPFSNGLEMSVYSSK